jgi:hypothetical protein
MIKDEADCLPRIRQNTVGAQGGVPIDLNDRRARSRLVDNSSASDVVNWANQDFIDSASNQLIDAFPLEIGIVLRA